MIRLAEVIHRFGTAFVERYADQLEAHHRAALVALPLCRSSASPRLLLECSGCDQQRLVPHSCGHRHCPHCQHHESQQWLERQCARQLPATYFMVTLTVPAQLRPLFRGDARTALDALLRCAWDTVREFTRKDQQLSGQAGAIAVLHTHTRRLDFHPHVHLVMPAAAISAGRYWHVRRGRKGKRSFLFPQKALAKVFRGKLLEALALAGLSLPDDIPESWVADCKAVGTGEKALVYLGRYLYRGVIREQDIVAMDATTVTFRYREAKSGALRERTVDGAEFLWLVFQHVLPKGFRRARNYGFLHPNAKTSMALLQSVLRVTLPAVALSRPRPALACPCCGEPMRIVRTRIPILGVGLAGQSAGLPPETPSTAVGVMATM